MESWQSGNATDSKSVEPANNRRAGSIPVLSLKLTERAITITYPTLKQVVLDFFVN